MLSGASIKKAEFVLTPASPFGLLLSVTPIINFVAGGDDERCASQPFKCLAAGRFQFRHG